MRRRSVLALYHLTARAWLTAAAFSLLFPADVRRGLWLPLHLALAGAVSVAISGSMQTFTAGLTAAPDAPRSLVYLQLALVNVGAALVAAGVPTGSTWAVATGGTLFGASIVVLAAIIAWHRRRGLNRRFGIVFVFYGAAIASVTAGAVIGSLIGSRTITDGLTFVGLRDAHMAANVLGWATLTISGTFITFLPTVLRVKIPAWRSGPTAFLLLIAVAMSALGQAIRNEALAVAGAFSLVAGAAGLWMLAFGALRTPRRHFTAVSAKHLVMALVWFAGGAIALAAHTARALLGDDPVSLTMSGFRDTFLVTFVAGWILQTLLGAWLYLLPAQQAGGPADRKLLLAGVEHLATLQVALVNVGLALVAVGPLGAPRWFLAVGAWTAMAGVAIALGKAWGFNLLARLPLTVRRAEVLWTPRER